MKEGADTTGQEKVLGQTIAIARRKAGMTQQELCDRANLSYSTLAKIERGAIKTPSVFTVASIAEATGTTIEALAGIESNVSPNAPKKDYKTSRTGIKFVYFDVNGVLVRFYQRAFTKIAADYNVSIEKVESLYWKYDDKLNKGQMPIEEFNSLLAKAIDAKSVSWADYYLDNIDPIREMDDALRWVAESYHVGLLTNNWEGLTRTMLKRQLLPDIYYDAIVDSSEMGCMKPDKIIYEKAQQIANVEPQDILLVDDTRPNIMAAEHVGWHVLWFDAYNPQASQDEVRQILE